VKQVTAGRVKQRLTRRYVLTKLSPALQATAVEIYNTAHHFGHKTGMAFATKGLLSCFCKIEENLLEYRKKERGKIEGMEGKR
jgi:hypothetical protein